jgi:taurine dioxygenase
MEMRVVSKTLGAEISKIDLSQPLPSDDLTRLRQSWLDHKVLVIRDADLSEEDQDRFCRYFGDIAGLKSKNSNSKFLFVTNEEDPDKATAVQLGEMMFHIDQAYAESPCKASTLYSMVIPDEGGNTCFADCEAAYDGLGDDLKAKIEGRSALNYFNYGTNPSSRPDEIDPAAPQHTHPIIRTHPETGRKGLFVNRLMTMRIEGMDRAESDALLEQLFDRLEAPGNVYEHIWQVGDLVLWDNRCTAHARTWYDPAKRRLLRRMTILDENPVMAA